MKYKILIILVISLMAALSDAMARPIISGISTNEIDIDTNFTGTEILLFGAKGDSGDIVVVVRGPKKNYLINKKSEFLGIWHNEKRVKLKNTYSYYATFSSNYNFLSEDAELLSRLEVGQENIKFNAINKSKVDDNSIQIFQQRFIDYQEKEQLYHDDPDKIEFLDETLFKLHLKFPKNIASGVYTAEIYLIDDNNLLAFQAIPIYVNQIGLSAKIHNMAYDNYFLYGLMAVFMALASGWLANFIFNKFFWK